MGLRNVLLVVNDIEKSRRFYQEIFGLYVTADFGENVMLSEGLVLQERKQWEQLIGEEIKTGNSSELFFTVHGIEKLIEKLRNSDWQIHVVNDLQANSWGRKTFRFRDPDGHIIEVAEGAVEHETA